MIQEIPNVVGRMDPVVEALGRGEWGEARALLVKEAARRDAEILADSSALDKRLNQALQLCGFLERLDRGEGLDEIRAACSGDPAKPDDPDRDHLIARLLPEPVDVREFWRVTIRKPNGKIWSRREFPSRDKAEDLGSYHPDFPDQVFEHVRETVLSREEVKP